MWVYALKRIPLDGPYTIEYLFTRSEDAQNAAYWLNRVGVPEGVAYYVQMMEVV